MPETQTSELPGTADIEAMKRELKALFCAARTCVRCRQWGMACQLAHAAVLWAALRIQGFLITILRHLRPRPMPNFSHSTGSVSVTDVRDVLQLVVIMGDPLEEPIMALPSLEGTKMLISQKGCPLFCPPEYVEDLRAWFLHDGPPPPYWQELVLYQISPDASQPFHGTVPIRHA